MLEKTKNEVYKLNNNKNKCYSFISRITKDGKIIKKFLPFKRGR